jgi:agmatine deiminase
MEQMTETPNHDYRMPAEWAPHAATWIAWPHNAEDWPGKFQPIPWVYAEIVRHLSAVEDVHILVNTPDAENRATGHLRRAGANMARTHFHSWPTDRVWLRDSGPIFVKNPHGDLAVTNWKFNAWAKYDNWRRDNLVPHHVAQHYDIPEFCAQIDLSEGKPAHRIVLEGGSIDTNGAGILLTTEECLLSDIQQRNPGLGDCEQTRQHLEAAFKKYLGIDQTIWLNRGCAGDDTHGHVDDITRFVPGPDDATNIILTAVEKNTRDENHLPLAENLDRLRAARIAHGPHAGQPFDIRQLPMPNPVIFAGQRLPASYANFYIANDLVLVPTFNDPHDRHALNIIASCFPTREVIGIHAVDLVWGLGTLHCMTQQEPA